MPGNICPTFYSYLSQQDSLQIQHKYIQAIILTYVESLVYPLPWPSASYTGARKETKHYSSFGEGKLRHKGIKFMIFSVSGQVKAWVLQGAKSEPRAQSASRSLCLSWNNSESWNNRTTDCLLPLLAASCYRRLQYSPALPGGIFSSAWGMHKGFDFPDRVLRLKYLLTQIKVLISDLAKTPWNAGWNTTWFSFSFICQA